MRYEEINLGYEKNLVRYYLTGYDRVAKFYHYNPWNTRSFYDRADYLKDKSNPEALYNLLSFYLKDFALDQKVVENLDKIKKGAFIVLTGQQPGFLTGPLYTIYKAVHAIIEAKRLSELLNHEVVPLFWIGSEDHDVEEVNFLYFPGKEGPQEIKIEFTDLRKIPAGLRPAEPETVEAIEKFEGLLPNFDYKEEVFTEIKKAYHSANLGQAFARLMLKLFGKFGLLVYDGLNPEFKRVTKGYLKNAFLKRDAIEKALFKVYTEQQSLGIEPQLDPCPNHCNMFIFKNDERIALEVAGEKVVSRDGEVSFTREEFLEFMERYPEKLSPNLVVRTSIQSLVFPVLAYVAGPGEIGYYGMLKEVYEIMGTQMPVILPRFTATLIEPRVEKALKEFALLPQEIYQDYDGVFHRVLERLDNLGIDDTFKALKESINSAYKNLQEKLAPLGADFQKLTGENLGRVMAQVKYLEERAQKYHREKNSKYIEKLWYLKTNFLPENEWQERVYNVFYYLAKYGFALIEKLLGIPFNPGKHYLLYLE
ncbi:bacillithiol biosynthesis cysteine-adding enzyme BshC [Carboxydothermus hydrogenoformans]|uniref:Putative cysteine ligase BshC n=1 Tax=Carboxydothermus hydrogenoformans (strain ATCC BAA-161 / DSM 6008 / Z-2901) TaxID=246194 RepID=BSHC_CARHZ|nr:bacillithiol biosynthesis cysteine-adding enzyme BshC [Carboxydothermus hydrogenoformans]Q3AAW3.1 RecName: Full=Putative cysteine ligase BshC [Carboxydothermus hydrogenoformans Z-2901]ABB14445.1 conserved hypothetical protein [Carboxydothermus hydrogenoformans Z-2901]